MSNQQFEFECALSGVTEPAAQEDDCDGMGDVPVGWTRVHFTRRQFNPRWLAIQQVKEATIEGIISRVPPEIKELQRIAVSLQIDAQFFALEENTPMYLLDVDDTVYVSDSGEVAHSMNEIREMVGLEALTVHEDEEDEEDEGDKEETSVAKVS